MIEKTRGVDWFQCGQKLVLIRLLDGEIWECKISRFIGGREALEYLAIMN